MVHFTITDNTTWPAFNLRMSDELKTVLKAHAVKNKRSLNSEIIYRLTQSVEGYRKL